MKCIYKVFFLFCLVFKLHVTNAALVVTGGTLEAIASSVDIVEPNSNDSLYQVSAQMNEDIVSIFTVTDHGGDYSFNFVPLKPGTKPTTFASSTLEISNSEIIFFSDTHNNRFQAWGTTRSEVNLNLNFSTSTNATYKMETFQIDNQFALGLVELFDSNNNLLYRDGCQESCRSGVVVLDLLQDNYQLSITTFASTGQAPSPSDLGFTLAEIKPVPVPAALWLFLTGLLGLLLNAALRLKSVSHSHKGILGDINTNLTTQHLTH